MNKVILVGRLGADPEIRAIQGGSLCSFSLATSESWAGSDGTRQERTDWHRVVVFRKLADICAKYLTKGSQVLIEGKLQTRSWEDESGAKRYSTEIVANEVKFLDTKKDDEIPY